MKTSKSLTRRAEGRTWLFLHQLLLARVPVDALTHARALALALARADALGPRAPLPDEGGAGDAGTDGDVVDGAGPHAGVQLDRLVALLAAVSEKKR